MTASAPPIGAGRPLRLGRLQLAPVLIWVAGALVFFRGPVFSGFIFVTGDDGDARLIVYLHEHWIDVLRGRSPWRSPGFFYPAPGALGGSDTFVLDEIWYAPIRLAGADPFLAYQWTLILASLLGFVGCHLLCLRILVGRPLLSALLAGAFTFSNVLYVQAGHSQLSAVYWLPVLVLLVLRWRSRPAAPARAFAVGALASLLLLSTYYIGWFALFAAVLWRVVLALLDGRATTRRTDTHGTRAAGTPGARRLAQRAVAVLSEHRRPLLFCLLGAAVGLVPFLLVYLPAASAGGRSLPVALSYAAQPRDVVNLGRRNYFWGPLVRWVFGSSPRLSNGELGFGLPPLTLTAALLSTGHFVRRVRAPGGGRRLERVGSSTGIVALAVILLPMKVFGLSGWLLVWYLVPGAHAIRAIDRMAILSGLLGLLVLALALADLMPGADQGRPPEPVRSRPARPAVAAGALLALLMIEQFNVGRVAGIDRGAENRALAAVPAPPAVCRAFVLTGVPAGRTGYAASIDAMLISQRIGLPTVNGFSGLFPPGYGVVADPGSRGYPAAVRRWTADHQITGLCRYDQRTRSWSPRLTTG